MDSLMYVMEINQFTIKCVTTMERIRLDYTIGVKSKEYGFHFHKESKKET